VEILPTGSGHSDILGTTSLDLYPTTSSSGEVGGFTQGQASLPISVTTSASGYVSRIGALSLQVQTDTTTGSVRAAISAAHLVLIPSLSTGSTKTIFGNAQIIFSLDTAVRQKAEMLVLGWGVPI